MYGLASWVSFSNIPLETKRVHWDPASIFQAYVQSQLHHQLGYLATHRASSLAFPKRPLNKGPAQLTLRTALNPHQERENPSRLSIPFTQKMHKSTINLPSVGSHSRCDTWEGRRVQIWLCGSALAPNTGTLQVPNETQSSQGPRGLTSQKERPLRRNKVSPSQLHTSYNQCNT